MYVGKHAFINLEEKTANSWQLLPLGTKLDQPRKKLSPLNPSSSWKRIVLRLWVTFENKNVDIVKVRMALPFKKCSCCV